MNSWSSGPRLESRRSPTGIRDRGDRRTPVHRLTLRRDPRIRRPRRAGLPGGLPQASRQQSFASSAGGGLPLGRCAVGRCQADEDTQVPAGSRSRVPAGGGEASDCLEPIRTGRHEQTPIGASARQAHAFPRRILFTPKKSLVRSQYRPLAEDPGQPLARGSQAGPSSYRVRQVDGMALGKHGGGVAPPTEASGRHHIGPGSRWVRVTPVDERSRPAGWI
jgi:hypothetical protein